jgi:uncharacterized protein
VIASGEVFVSRVVPTGRFILMKYYTSFSGYLKDRFCEKVRRVSLDPGFPCPKRSDAAGGVCLYCDGSAFSGTVLKGASLRDQLAVGIDRAMERGVKKHIAYFQDSTPTNVSPDKLKRTCDVIREFPSIVALSISTRPDCIDDEKLDVIAGYLRDYDVWMEYGLQTANNRTLDMMRRGHTYEQAEDAVKKTFRKGIKAAVHVILGLPGETKEDMLKTAAKISALPLWGVKLHVLHVLRGTGLERLYHENKVRLFTMEGYAEAVCDFLEHIPEEMVVLRLVSDAREENLIAPRWINDKLKAINMIEREFALRRTKQGFFSETVTPRK